ncbi:hypothetical protein H2200_007649 [Cladophialophora chaetospira]|uniref:Uncharacterized protein n=1 Tax=Cladophialophora chaetospira TaxID=386627 RepID=A0AA39CGA5_9EURO|nr:hypothetical protein H2200_007649 [Cladophialophora chaetospira]
MSQSSAPAPEGTASTAQAAEAAVDEAVSKLDAQGLRSLLQKVPRPTLTFQCGLDIGTTTSSGAIDIAKISDEATEENVPLARIEVTQNGNGDFWIPTKAAIIHRSRNKELGGNDTCEMVFGHDVDKGLKDGSIREEDVFDLIKYMMLSEYRRTKRGRRKLRKDRIVAKVRKSHFRLCKKIREMYGGVVEVEDMLTNSTLEAKIRRIDDVMVAYLGFFRRCALLQLAETMEIKLDGSDDHLIKKLEYVIERMSHVAASVPAIWPKKGQDRFVNLLGRARFPKSTVIPSEPASAALYDFTTTSSIFDSDGSSQNLLVSDTGGGSADVIVIRKYRRNGKARFGAIGSARGSRNGSLQLSQMLEKCLFKKLGPIMRSGLSTGQYADFCKQLKHGIELQKRTFDNREAELSIRIPVLRRKEASRINQARLRQLGFRLEDCLIVLSTTIFKDAFDQWLKRLVDLSLAALDEFYEKYPNESLREIALCGRGAFPPYVLERCKELLPGFNVRLIEDKNVPIIAQGNFVTLSRGDLFSNVVARNSYGIRYDMPVDKKVRSHPKYKKWLEKGLTEDGDFLRDRLLWFIKKGANLFDPKTPGNDDAVDSFELPFRKLKQIGQVFTVLRFKWVMHQKDVGIAAMKNLEGFPYIDFDFRGRVHFNKLRPTLVLSIPASGGMFTSRLTKDWTETVEDCYGQKIQLGHVYTHANLSGNREAKLDAGNHDLDDDPESDFDEHEDSGEVVKVKSTLSQEAKAEAGISEIGPRHWYDSRGPKALHPGTMNEERERWQAASNMSTKGVARYTKRSLDAVGHSNQLALQALRVEAQMDVELTQCYASSGEDCEMKD